MQMTPTFVQPPESKELSETDQDIIDALGLLDSFDYGPCKKMEPQERKLLYIRVFKECCKEAFEELDSDESIEIRKRFKEYSTYLSSRSIHFN